jgi:hypothetical protein
MTSTTADARPSPPLWPWVLVGLALGWAALLRIPLILNAETHLDSDLAVDGLTVADVVRGHWHWHFPGTPHIGIASVVLAGPQMLLGGANAYTLVSGGLVAYVVLVLAIFLLAWTAFGPRVAAWSLVPLTFCSTGTLWLTGRLNGGHLLAAAWHAGAIALLYQALARGGVRRAAALGLWCGLGMWHDSMFLITVATVIPVAAVAWWASGHARNGLSCALAFVLAAAVGDLPREIGRRVEPYDAYREQFAPVFDPSVLAEHLRILGLGCIPRLISGHLLPDMRTEPSQETLLGHPVGLRTGLPFDPLAWSNSLVGLLLFAVAWLALIRDRTALGDVPRSAARWAILLSSAAIAVAFVLNKNIFNSDNYRYIIYFLVPWCVGFGLAMDRLARRAWWGAVPSTGLAFLLAALMTLDTFRWYEQLGWIQADGRPVRKEVPDPALRWLGQHPEVTAIFAGYWDAYRLTFLTGGRVKGVPYPIYPDRFPEWSREIPGGRPRVLLVRPTSEGMQFRVRAIREGGSELLVTPYLAIYDWPPRK